MGTNDVAAAESTRILIMLRIAADSRRKPPRPSRAAESKLYIDWWSLARGCCGLNVASSPKLVRGEFPGRVRDAKPCTNSLVVGNGRALKPHRILEAGTHSGILRFSA